MTREEKEHILNELAKLGQEINKIIEEENKKTTFKDKILRWMGIKF